MNLGVHHTLMIGLEMYFVPQTTTILGPAVQLVFNPPHRSTYLAHTSSACLLIMGDDVKGLTKVETNNIHCSPHPTSQLSYHGRLSHQLRVTSPTQIAADYSQ